MNHFPEENNGGHNLAGSIVKTNNQDSQQYVSVPQPVSEDATLRRLRESEERYRLLIAATTQIVWTTSVDGMTMNDLDSWCQYTGQQPEEAQGESLLAAIHPDDRVRVGHLWFTSIKTLRPYQTVFRLRRYDGVYRTFLTRGVPVIDELGEVREWVGTCTDITEQRQLEEQLSESERRFRLTFELVAVGVAHIGLDGDFLLVNQKLCDFLGYTRSELERLNFQRITYADDLAQEVVYMAQLLSNEKADYAMEKRYIRKDGTMIWANLKVSLMRDECGIPTYFIVVVEDITERKQKEEEYRQLLAREQAARAYAETIIETIADGVFVYDAQGRIMRNNSAAQELFPVDYRTRPASERAQIMMMRDMQGRVLSHEQLPITRLLHGEVFKGANAEEVLMNAADRHDIHVSVSGAPIYDAEGHISGAVTVFRDVTERRFLERRSHDALSGLLKMAESLVLIPDGHGHKHDSANRVYALGHHLAELTCSVLACHRVSLSIIEPETEIAHAVAVVGLAPEQERAWWLEQEQRAGSLKDNPLPELIERLRTGEVLILDMSEPPFRAMPNPYHIKVMLVVPMCVRDQLVGLLTLDYDTDEHRYTDNEVRLASAVAKLAGLVFERERLLQERMDAEGRILALHEANRRMEEFLGIASHELRTPMTTIKANIQLAQRRLTALARTNADELVAQDVHERARAAQDMLARAEHQVAVLNRLVGDLIDISRIQTDKLQLHLRQEPCDLLSIVYEAVQEQCKANPTRTIQFTPTLDEKLLIYADSDRIMQVIVNYIGNALKYSSSDEPVLVQLEQEEETARVLVSDHGPGVPLKEQQHIWDCFYQAEDINVQSGSGVGLGLGLYISKTIIERHGGHIGVQSSPPDGATFWFTLPLAYS